jgi:hypothetical protein
MEPLKRLRMPQPVGMPISAVPYAAYQVGAFDIALSTKGPLTWTVLSKFFTARSEATNLA